MASRRRLIVVGFFLGWLVVNLAATAAGAEPTTTTVEEPTTTTVAEPTTTTTVEEPTTTTTELPADPEPAPEIPGQLGLFEEPAAFSMGDVLAVTLCGSLALGALCGSVLFR